MNDNHLFATTGCAILLLLIGFVAGWMFRTGGEQPVPAFQIVSDQSFGVFLLDRVSGDTWKWFVKQSDDDEAVRMGWQYHTRPVKLNAATMENVHDLMRSSP